MSLDYIEMQTVVQEAIEKQLGFMTSADVIMKACGLHFETIRAIAQRYGTEIDNASSRCIDEDLILLLADAHVSQIKSYFRNAHRHLSELDCDELSDFVAFCDVFKKKDVSGAPTSWDDIDTNAIREQFIRKVRSLTDHRSIFSMLLNNDGLNLSEAILSSKEATPEELLSLFKEDCIIKRVVRSRWLYVPKVNKVSFNTNSGETVRMVTLSARYYVFPKEDCHIA